MTEEKQGGSGFGWFLLGLGIGAAAGVLYAPKAGSETRGDLAEGVRGGGEYLKQKSRVAADQVSNLVGAGRESLGEYVDRGKQAVERGRTQLENYVDRGRQAVAEHSDRISAAIDAGKSAYKSTTAGEQQN